MPGGGGGVSQPRGGGGASGTGPSRLSAARSHELNEEYLKLQEEAYRLLEGRKGATGSATHGQIRSAGTSGASEDDSLRGGSFNDSGESDIMESFTVGRIAEAAPHTRKTASTSTSSSSSSVGPSSRQSSKKSSSSIAAQIAQSSAPKAMRASAAAPHHHSHPNADSSGDWYGFLAEPPTDPQGSLVQISDRPLVCASSLNDKVVVGGTDHALYEIDLSSNPSSSTSGGGRHGSSGGYSVRRRLYNKNNGHSEWVTDVKYLADGRIVSAAMDSKLCLWDSGRGVRCIELSGHTGSVSCIAVHSGSVRFRAGLNSRNSSKATHVHVHPTTQEGV